jgi:TP901 family phage tail tape measure protein
MAVVATLLVRVAANLTELDKSFTELERSADRVAKSWAKLGGQLQGIGSKLTTGITLPIAALGIAAGKSAMDFDSAMRGVQAAVQPTTAELDELKAAAVEWGQKTQFSATEAAQALGELGKAGVKSSDAVALLPSVLNLATVGEMDLAEAAATTTDTLAQFNLKTKDAGRVNDVLAAGAQKSTTSVKELRNALVQVGSVASGFGMGIEETTGALAAFANIGLKGEKAGTALKNMFTAIVNPMKGMTDVLGELGLKTLASADGTVHLAEVVEKLGNAGASNAQIVRAFGEVAGPGMVALVNKGAGSIRELTVEMEKSGGTADRVAKTLLSGLGGAWESMTGAIETASISIGTILAPALEMAAGLVGDLAGFVSSTLVPAFEALPSPLKIVTGGFVALLAAAGPLVYLAGTMAQSWSGLVGLFAKSAGAAGDLAGATGKLTLAMQAESVGATIATAATTAFASVVAFVTSPITLTVAAIAALVLGLRYLTGSWEGVLKVLSLGALDFATVEGVFADLKTIADELGGALSSLGTILDRELGPVLASVQTLARNLGLAFQDPMASGVRDLNGAANEAANGGLGRLLQILGQIAVAPAWGVLDRGVGIMNRAAEGAKNVGGWFRYFAGTGEYAADATTAATASFRDFVAASSGVQGTLEAAGLASGVFGDEMGRLAVGGGAVVRSLADVTAASGRHASAAAASGEATKKAAAEAKKAAEEYQKLRDALTGKDVIARASELTRVLADLTVAGLKPSAAGMKQVSDALDDAADVIRSQSRKVPDWMGTIWAAMQPPTAVVDDLRNWGDLFGRSIARVIPTLKHNLAPMQQALVQAFQIPDPNLGAQVAKFLRGAALKDQITRWGADLQVQVTGILSSMFTGQTGFAEGFRSMFNGLQTFAGSIMNSFMRDFQQQIAKAFEGGSFDLGELFGGEKNKAAGAAAGAAVGLTVGLAFGKAFGKTTGALVGAGSGAAMGAVYGGWVGAGVGAAVGAISGYLGGLTQEKAQRAALENAKSQLVATFGSAEKLGEAATQAGISFHALFDTRDPEAFTRQLNFMNEALARNKLAVENMAKAFDRTTQAGTLLSQVDLSRMALNLGQLPTAPTRETNRGPLPGSQEATFAFLQAQQNAALQGLDAFLSTAKIKTQAGATAISASLAGIYQTLLEGGASPTQAFAQMEPVVAKLQAQLAASGLAATTAFGPLAALAKLSADEVGGPLMDAMAGLAQGLTSTANLGLLNQESFHGFAQEILAGYQGMEALGQGGEVALAGARDGIQRLYELSKDFGYKLEADEQAMVDFGIASGTVGDQFRAPADRMAVAIEALVDRMEKFLLKFEEIAPAATDASRAIERTLGDVKVPPIDVPFRPRWEEDYPGGGTAPPRAPSSTMAIPALAKGAIVSRPTVALIGESGPEAVVPLSKDFGATTDVTLMLDSEVLTRAVLRKQPRIMRAYGAAR